MEQGTAIVLVFDVEFGTLFDESFNTVGMAFQGGHRKRGLDISVPEKMKNFPLTHFKKNP